MAELTPTGLDVLTQSEIQEEIQDAQLAEISSELDLSTSSPLGQLNRLLARALRMTEEALAAVYLAIDPDSATGDALFRLGALTGTIREPATSSRIAEVVCDLDAGTYLPGVLVGAPSGRPLDRFSNVATVTVVAPGPVSVIFEAEETGPIECAADDLEIASPLAGWNSIDSNDAAVLGQDIETEAAFRRRRQAEVEAPGSSSASGIVADITQNIVGVISAFVTENDGDTTVDSIPPHSFEAVVYGPAVPTDDDDDEVAAQILASKAAGIGTYGTTTRTVYDSEGQPHAISFTRPADVDITVALTVRVSATDYAGDAALADHIAERAADLLVPGLDASWSQILGWAHEVRGVLRCTTITLNGSSPFTDVAITTRQIARIAALDVLVTSSTAAP